MIRTGDEYRDSIRDGRDVWIDGERVKDVTEHPMFKPLVDARARIYDMAHDDATRDVMSYVDPDTGERNAIGLRLPHTREDWHDKRRAVDAVMDDLRRRRDPGRRRDRRRDVVAVRRPGRPQRGRPAVLGEHHAPHPPRAARRPVPRVRQHGSQGRSLEASPGSGPGHAAAPGSRDRQRHRRARRQVRDGGGLREPGVREADHCQLGRQRAVRLRAGLHRRHGLAGDQAHLPHRLRRPAAGRGLPAGQPLRRGRHAGRVRRRRGAVGERAVLPPHPRRHIHPGDAAPLQRVRRSSSGSSGSPTC